MQKISVINSLPQLISEDPRGCVMKIIPKINQGLLQGSTEYHMYASTAVRTVIDKKLLQTDQIVQNFLHSVLRNTENRDREVSKAWFETLLEIVSILPFNIINKEIMPTVTAKTDLSKPVVQRIMCCRLLGRIAKSCNPYVLKKDVFPLIQALGQDPDKEVRAAVCLELPVCASILTATLDKDILPMLNELANDNETVVKVAAYQAIVDIIPSVSTDTLRSSMVALAKKMIQLSMQPYDDELKKIVSKNFGKICLGFERVMSSYDKTWFVERFVVLAQLGLPNLKIKDRVIQKPTSQARPQGANASIECRLNCAFNIPAVLKFALDMDKHVIVTVLAPIIYDLSTDPYFLVRQTIALGIHEVAKLLRNDNRLIVNCFIRLLKDDTEEVLKAVVPNFRATMEALVESKTISVDYVDESAIELTRALLKCEAEINNTYNWRLHSAFLEQLSVLPKCVPSDFLYTQFVPLVFKRVFSCRPIPCRMSAVKTILVFLRYNLKISQRNDIRNRLIAELCCSKKFYDRMIYARSCDEIINRFSSNYFREYFFTRTLQLAEDKVANIRLLLYSLMPKLKSIAKAGEKTMPKCLQMIDTVMRNSRHERDKDVIKCIASINSQLEAINDSFKPDPTDAEKLEEERRLAAVPPSNKEYKPIPLLGTTGQGGGTNVQTPSIRLQQPSGQQIGSLTPSSSFMNRPRVEPPRAASMNSAVSRLDTSATRSTSYISSSVLGNQPPQRPQVPDISSRAASLSNLRPPSNQNLPYPTYSTQDGFMRGVRPETSITAVVSSTTDNSDIDASKDNVESSPVDVLLDVSGNSDTECNSKDDVCDNCNTRNSVSDSEVDINSNNKSLKKIPDKSLKIPIRKFTSTKDIQKSLSRRYSSSCIEMNTKNNNYANSISSTGEMVQIKDSNNNNNSGTNSNGSENGRIPYRYQSKRPLSMTLITNTSVTTTDNSGVVTFKSILEKSKTTGNRNTSISRLPVRSADPRNVARRF